jgi:hypothetical protein
MNLQKEFYLNRITKHVLSEEDSPEQKAYKDLFAKILKKYGADSPNDISKEKKDDFFNEVEKEWASHPDNKKDDGESVNEYGGPPNPKKKKKEKNPMSEEKSISESYRRMREGGHVGGGRPMGTEQNPQTGGEMYGGVEGRPMNMMPQHSSKGPRPGANLGVRPGTMPQQDTPEGEMIGNLLSIWGQSPADLVQQYMDQGIAQEQAIQLVILMWGNLGGDYNPQTNSFTPSTVDGQMLGNLLTSFGGG